MSKTMFKKTAVPKPSGGPIAAPTGNQPTQTTDATPTGTVPRPGGTGGQAARPSGGGGSYQVVGAIKDMQTAMQDFAALATTYGSARQQPGQAAPPKVDSRKKHFNDFITEQYLANSDLKGEEFTPDEKRISKEQKQPTDLIEMNLVLNGLQRIGGPASELKADNQWDFRTNNALKNIYAFAYGLVNIAKDFGKTDAQSFTEDDLAKMKELIPADRDPKDIPGAEKVAKAKALTPLIRKLTNFYKYYINSIAQHPGWTKYITGNESMMTVQKGGGDPTALDANDQKTMSSIDSLQLGANAIPYITTKFPINFPSPQGTGGAIGLGSMPLSALQNINTFRAFMTSMGIPQNQTSDPRWAKAAINAVMDHVEKVLNLPEAQEKSALPPPTPAPPPQTGDFGTGPRQDVRKV